MVCEQITDSALALELAGAYFIVITCNDVHRFIPEIEKNVAIPFLHIAQVTAEAINTQVFKNVAILGVGKTIEEDFYSSLFTQNGLASLIPSEAERAFIHQSIYEELVQIEFRDNTRTEYRSIITKLAERGADCVALAHTEIPLLLSIEQSPLPAFPTTEIYCLAAVRRALDIE